MILLDTNVLSEIMRPSRSANVVHWLDAQPQRSIYISTVLLAELRFGLELLPPSSRRTAYERAYERVATELFVNRILSFDRTAASQFGRIRAERHKSGRPISPMDALVAAIALANTMTLATRNTVDFWPRLGQSIRDRRRIAGLSR